jgi:hypothetical protein
MTATAEACGTRHPSMDADEFAPRTGLPQKAALWGGEDAAPPTQVGNLRYQESKRPAGMGMPALQNGRRPRRPECRGKGHSPGAQLCAPTRGERPAEGVAVV